MNEKEKKNTGKFLSLVLRHNPGKINIELDPNGWADVNELMSKCAAKKVYFTFDELIELVETNDKKRYSFNEEKTMIRANQGHSIEVDLEFKPVTPPDFLFHGTVEKFLESIKEEGLKKMSRQHVHLSKDLETATKVGSRRGKPIILEVNTQQMFNDGHSFYLSENGVWLTDAVPSKYIIFTNE